MKKLLGLLITMFAFTASVNSAPLKADVTSEHIPSGTVIAVRVADSLDSEKALEYDRFDVITVADIVAGTKMILPKGTVTHTNRTAGTMTRQTDHADIVGQPMC